MLLAITITTLTNNVLAQDFSYNFLQLSFSSTTADVGVDLDGTGVGISASIEINNNIAFITNYRGTSFDRLQGIDFDTTELSFGILGHTEISPSPDFFGSFSILNLELKFSDAFDTFKTDDDGNIISIGIRHIASNNVELNATAARTDVFDDTSNSFSFGTRFYANKKTSLAASFVSDDDLDSIVLDARIDF